MKKIIPLIITMIFFCANLNSFGYDRREKMAFEEIETLFLKEDFKSVKTKCDRFLRNYRNSRLRKRVQQLRDIASKKISGVSEKKEILKKEDKEKEIYYIVQIGAFKKYNNALKLKRSLKKRGFDSVILKVRKNRQIFYRVRAGKFKYLENAENLVRGLKKKGYTSEIINEE